MDGCLCLMAIDPQCQSPVVQYTQSHLHLMCSSPSNTPEPCKGQQRTGIMKKPSVHVTMIIAFQNAQISCNRSQRKKKKTVAITDPKIPQPGSFSDFSNNGNPWRGPNTQFARKLFKLLAAASSSPLFPPLPKNNIKNTPVAPAITSPCSLISPYPGRLQWEAF